MDIVCSVYCYFIIMNPGHSGPMNGRTIVLQVGGAAMCM